MSDSWIGGASGSSAGAISPRDGAVDFLAEVIEVEVATQNDCCATAAWSGSTTSPRQERE